MKYADHLPLYRQETIFERAGLRIVRSTLADWVGACGAQLELLVDALREQVLAHSVLHTDETPLQYYNHQKKAVKRGYVWVYVPGEFESLKAVIYDVQPGCSGAWEFLGDWRGSLMCVVMPAIKRSLRVSKSLKAVVGHMHGVSFMCSSKPITARWQNRPYDGFNCSTNTKPWSKA